MVREHWKSVGWEEELLEFDSMVDMDGREKGHYFTVSSGSTLNISNMKK